MVCITWIKPLFITQKGAKKSEISFKKYAHFFQRNDENVKSTNFGGQVVQMEWQNSIQHGRGDYKCWFVPQKEALHEGRKKRGKKAAEMFTMEKKLIHLMTKVLVPVLMVPPPFPLPPCNEGFC